jgi:uncharacterized protein (DUF885 family)
VLVRIVCSRALAVVLSVWCGAACVAANTTSCRTHAARVDVAGGGATSRGNGDLAPPIDADDAAIAKAAEDYLALLVDVYPEAATSLGLHARDAELDDRTPPGLARTLAREDAMLASLRARFAKPRASRAALADLALLESALAVDVRAKRERRPLQRQPDFYVGPLNALFLMTARDYAPAAERARAALLRMEKIAPQLAAAEATLESPPRVWTQVGIEQAHGASAFFDEQRAFLESALPAEKARIDRVLTGAKSAYERYARFLERDVLPRSTGHYAAGPELFGFLLRESYFLDETADQILARGERLVISTQAQMNEVAKRIDPAAKDWAEVTARVKANHPSAAELIPAYRREVARARKFLVDKDVVPFPAGDDCQVMETPAFQRSTITAAYDPPPPFDRSTKGLFFVTPIDPAAPPAKQEEMLRENDHGDMVDTSVHEAYPGHHLQHSFARRHPSLARKAVWSSIFAEGWGLYAEEVMAELGYYTDEERLMQLEWTLVRAVRVVIDVGLHTRGMTFETAVGMLTGVAHLGRELAESEVKRYTLEPTQPLSYLVGREMIFRLRDKYRAREGAAYTLKRFHADLLSHGTIPPGLIEREMF